MSSKDVNHPPFGTHLMLDGYNCAKEPLENANILFELLDKLPMKIGMTKMTAPYIVFTEGNDKKDPGGWSGFVLIQESHISIHTFIKRKFFTFDVYSCKEFDTQIVIDHLKSLFQTEDLEYTIEERGKRYPTENLE